MLLDHGCLCCDVRSDLVRTAADLRRGAARRRGLRRVVVETSSLADPAPILHALMTDREIADAPRRNRGIVTVVDAVPATPPWIAIPRRSPPITLADRSLLTKSTRRTRDGLACGPGTDQPGAARSPARTPRGQPASAGTRFTRIRPPGDLHSRTHHATTASRPSRCAAARRLPPWR